MIMDNFFIFDKRGECVLQRQFSYGGMEAAIVSGKNGVESAFL
jgi:hypothetical protein